MVCVWWRRLCNWLMFIVVVVLRCRWCLVGMSYMLSNGWCGFGISRYRCLVMVVVWLVIFGSVIVVYNGVSRNCWRLFLVWICWRLFVRC